MRWLRGHRGGSSIGRSPGTSVDLVDGGSVDADLVVYALGHNGRQPADQTAALIAEAARAGLTYVPPAFTADADLSALAPGQDVIVRGMGLAAVDLVVLLAEGRGGRFLRDGRWRAALRAVGLRAAAAHRLAPRGPLSLQGVVGDSG